MIPIRLSPGVWSPVIRRIAPAPARPAMAITFDDGPDPETTPQVIDALAKAGAKSTHFLLGERAERHPELVAALIAAGHDVYAHGWSHDLYAAGQGDAAAAALARTETLLRRHRPTPATYLVRLPYNAGFTRVAIHRALRRFHPNIQFAWWSHAITDYTIAATRQGEPAIRAAIADAVAQFEARDDLQNGVLLLHDAPCDTPPEAARMTTRLMVPEVMRVLTAKSFDLVGLQPRPAASMLSRFFFRSPAPVTVVANA